MPFQSKAQMKWMYANKPEMAKSWASEQKAQGKSFKTMPEKKNPWNGLKNKGK